jgi:multicomponent Na+:H+ antiporter subunit G
VNPFVAAAVGTAIIGGSALLLLAAVGAVRLPETMARMHAAAKAPALGLLLLLPGTAVLAPTARESLVLVLAAVLQLIVSPLAAHMLARAAQAQQDFEGSEDEAIDLTR